jgi:hypothetical protein
MLINRRIPDRGFLSAVEQDVLVEFQYNPDSVTDQRQLNYASLTAPGMLLPDRQYTNGGDRTIRFKVRVDGLLKGPAEDAVQIARGDNHSILPELNKYRAFVYPQTDRWQDANGSFIWLYGDTHQFVRPSRCILGLGYERLIDCVVLQVNIKETLFNAELAPIRAEIDISVVEINPYEYF